MNETHREREAGAILDAIEAFADKWGHEYINAGLCRGWLCIHSALWGESAGVCLRRKTHTEDDRR